MRGKEPNLVEGDVRDTRLFREKHWRHAARCGVTKLPGESELDLSEEDEVAGR